MLSELPLCPTRLFSSLRRNELQLNRQMFNVQRSSTFLAERCNGRPWRARTWSGVATIRDTHVPSSFKLVLPHRHLKAQTRLASLTCSLLPLNATRMCLILKTPAFVMRAEERSFLTRVDGQR
jgi:hypothetical protein